MSTIAIIEDNEDNLLLFEAMLEERFSTRAFRDGHSALDQLGELEVDLVLLDISLPGMDGIAVLGALRADPRTRELPVIALTAHAMQGDEERFLAAGFDAYLAKPVVDEEHFFAVIDRCLTGVEAR